MSTMMKRSLTITLTAALLAGVVSLAVSGTGGTEAIKARHEAMKTIGDSMGALAAIAKKQAPFDAAVVEKSAGTIAGELEKSAALFPPGSESGEAETWAKAEVWSDPEGFAKAMETSREAALAMKAVTAESDFGPALGRLGSSCKGCHETYRRPKE
jgi:cytochrome c556